MRFIVVILVALLAGCAVSQQNLARMSDEQLCGRYGEMRTNMFASGAMVKSLRDEIDRRDILTEREWRLVENKKIQQGMSVCALKASWGHSRDREYVGAYGKTVQHAFTCDICHVPGAFVYSEGGFVTGWSK